jgi:hypothetical protein
MKKRVGFLILAQRGPHYAAEDGVTSGGGYRLIGPSFDSLGNDAWQVCGSVSGGGYTLLASTGLTGRGSGCCCTYLPLGLRDFP